MKIIHRGDLGTIVMSRAVQDVNGVTAQIVRPALAVRRT